MRKLLFLLLAALLIPHVCVPFSEDSWAAILEANEHTPTPTKRALPTEPPTPSAPKYDKYADDGNYDGFCGRLYIPDVGIDVALYRGYYQSITDRKDSANLFSWNGCTGEIIADHSTQDFGALLAVTVGTTGYIQNADGSMINITCVAVLNGHNTGYDLTDEQGVSVMGKAAYAMYTCRNGWRNVRICLWDRV